MFKSTDRGLTWREKNFALPSFDVIDPVLQGYYSLAIDPSDSNVLYLGTFGHGLFRSWQGADTWMPMYGAGPVMEMGITRVAVDPTRPERIYLTSDAGVWRSPDSGGSWQDITANLDTRDVLSLEVASDGRVVVGTNGYGVYAYEAETDGLWTHLGVSKGIGEWKVWERRLYQYSALLFAPDDPNVVYLGHFPSGFFVSRDLGLTWTSQSLRLGNDGIFSLTVHPHEPAVLFAGTYNGIVRSDDAGHVWRASGAGLPDEQWTFAVVIDDARPNVMYATTKNGQNKGFCQRNTFCGVLMKSVDGGETWTRSMTGLADDREFYMLIIHPDHHDLLFVSTSKGIFGSFDAGASWHPVNTGLPTEEHRIRDNVAQNLKLAVDRRTLYLGLVDYGVWRADLTPLLDAL